MAYLTIKTSSMRLQDRECAISLFNSHTSNGWIKKNFGLEAQFKEFELSYKRCKSTSCQTALNLVELGSTLTSQKKPESFCVKKRFSGCVKFTYINTFVYWNNKFTYIISHFTLLYRNITNALMFLGKYTETYGCITEIPITQISVKISHIWANSKSYEFKLMQIYCI